MRCHSCRSNIRGFHYSLLEKTTKQILDETNFDSKACLIKSMVLSLIDKLGKDNTLRYLDDLKNLVEFNGKETHEVCVVEGTCNCD